MPYYDNTILGRKYTPLEVSHILLVLSKMLKHEPAPKLHRLEPKVQEWGNEYIFNGKVSKSGMPGWAEPTIPRIERAQRYVPNDALATMLMLVGQSVFVQVAEANTICTNTVLIRRSHVWRDYLGINPVGHPQHTEDDLHKIENMLIRLDQAGYIYFAAAGSLWSVDVREAV